MRKTQAKSIAIGAAISLLQGCELLHEQEAKKFVQEQVNECDGIVKSFVLVPASNSRSLYEGLAKVEIGGTEYDYRIAMKTGANGSIIESENDPCVEHELKQKVKSFLDIFR